MSADSAPSEARQEYLEDRKQRIELHNQAAQSCDKAVMTLAGGALGLSFTFIRQIVPQVQPSTIFILGLSWAFLALALITILVSLFSSQVSMQQKIAELDENYSPLPATKLKLSNKIGGKFYAIFGWSPLTQILNVTAIVLTVLGLGLLICFGLLNISAYSITNAEVKNDRK